MSPSKYSREEAIRQSPPLDFTTVTDDAWVKDKTIVITGGASGFGAAFLRRWAAAGATVIIGDINVKGGDQLVRDVAKSTGNTNIHFFHCDVTNWKSQVQFFKDAVKVSPHGGIDTVVANAGIIDANPTFEKPVGLDAADPPAPKFGVLDVNLTGVMYTTHLALFYLPRNPGSSAASANSDPAKSSRDRHLVLLSSVAGIAPIPGQTLYAVSKHAVVGLYRNLRCSSFMHGVRVNLICPYFIDTPMLDAKARVVLAGGAYGQPEDVVEAATKFVADPCILGRAVMVGPKLKVQEEDGQWKLAEGDKPGEEMAIREIYAHDFEETEIFTRNMIGIMNRIVEIRGWAGWVADMISAAKHGLGWRGPLSIEKIDCANLNISPNDDIAHKHPTKQPEPANRSWSQLTLPTSDMSSDTSHFMSDPFTPSSEKGTPHAWTSTTKLSPWRPPMFRLGTWSLTPRRIAICLICLLAYSVFNTFLVSFSSCGPQRPAYLTNPNPYNATTLPTAAFQPPEPLPHRYPDTIDTFSTYKYRNTCNISSLDLHAPFAPLCPNRASMIDAMSGGGRIGFDAPYMPRGCDMRWFSTEEICEILGRFEKVVILGDSMMRHVIGSINVLIRKDLGYGAVTDWNFSPEERRDCFCNYQFNVKACSIQGIFKTSDVVKNDPDSLACPANTVDVMIEQMIRFPIPPPELSRLRLLLPPSKPPKPYAFIFGHGLWNDLDLQATLDWLDLILSTIREESPWLSSSSSSSSSKNSPSSSKEKGMEETQERGKKREEHHHRERKRETGFFPRLFLTPNAAGKEKADEYLVSQGNKALMIFEEAVRVEVGRRGVEHLGTWNASVQGNKFDGVHVDLKGNLIKAMMVLNWLNMLEVEHF